MCVWPYLLQRHQPKTTLGHAVLRRHSVQLYQAGGLYHAGGFTDVGTESAHCHHSALNFSKESANAVHIAIIGVSAKPILNTAAKRVIAFIFSFWIGRQTNQLNLIRVVTKVPVNSLTHINLGALCNIFLNDCLRLFGARRVLPPVGNLDASAQCPKTMMDAKLA